MKKRIILLFLLVLCACSINNTKPNLPVKEDTTITDKIIEKHKLHSVIEDWGDALAGVYLLGYGDYYDFDLIQESSNFKLIYGLFSPIQNVENVYMESGEIMMIILSRYEDSTIVIEGLENDFYYESNDFDTILLSCNQSELRPDTRITITHNNEVISFEPFISMEDGRLQISNKILDLSLRPFPKDAIEGLWENDELILEFKDETIMQAHLKNKDILYEGNYYFEVFEDYKDTFDNANAMIYFDLANTSEHSQIYGKFVYSFKDEKTLLLKHLSYDPLTLEDELKVYKLKLKGD